MIKGVVIGLAVGAAVALGIVYLAVIPSLQAMLRSATSSPIYFLPQVGKSGLEEDVASNTNPGGKFFIVCPSNALSIRFWLAFFPKHSIPVS
jgi:hypothetical protein